MDEERRAGFSGVLHSDLVARIADLMVALTSSMRDHDFERVVDGALRASRESVGAQVGYLAEYEEHTSSLRLVGQYNVPVELLGRLEHFSVDDTFLASRAARTREVQQIHDVDTMDPRIELARELLHRAACRSMVSIPLLVSGQLVGVLTYLFRDERVLSADDLSILRVISTLFAAAMLRAHLHDRLALEMQRRLQSEEMLEQRERQLRWVVESAADGLFFADTSGRLTEVNDATCELLGYPREELLGKGLGEVVNPEDVPRLADARRRILYGAGTRDEWGMKRKNGDELVLEVTMKLLPDGRWLGVANDVTERSRVREQLALSESRFRLTVENAPIGMALMELDGKFLRVNEALTELVGYSADELAHMRFTDVTHPDDIAADLETVAQLLAGAVRRAARSKRYVHKDGRFIEVVVYVSIVRDPSGKPVHFVTQVLDMTERLAAERDRERLVELLEAEKNWLSTVIDRSPVGIILARGAHGEIVTSNETMVKFAGGPVADREDAAHSQKVFRNADGTFVDDAHRPLLRALAGETITGQEFRIVSDDRPPIVVHVNASPIFDGEKRIKGAVVVIDDVTAKSELARLRQEWVSMVVHDLRQPIGVINLHAQLLARHKAPDETAASSVGHIQTSARRLGRMVDDLLDASRLEARRLELRRRVTSLETLVRDVAARMRDEASGRPIRVAVQDTCPPLAVDPDRIEQVLGNLLSNAAKYGEPGAEVLVELERRENDVMISVTNHGRPIAAGDLDVIFERYARTRSSRREGVPGLGLGLYIARGIVEAHGGRIWAESPGRGMTTFRFTLSMEPTKST